MLLELCVTELEDVATDSQSGRLSSQPVVVESSHPYTDDTSTSGTVKIPGTSSPPPAKPTHYLAFASSSATHASLTLRGVVGGGGWLNAREQGNSFKWPRRLRNGLGNGEVICTSITVSLKGLHSSHFDTPIPREKPP